VYAQTAATINSSSVIPYDDSPPLNTEGVEWLTATITPKSTTSRLLVEATLNAGTDLSAARIICSLFQDSGTNAIAAAAEQVAAVNWMVNLKMVYSAISGSISPTTFRARLGPSTAGTVTTNGIPVGRLFGGASLSSIVIQEVV